MTTSIVPNTFKHVITFGNPYHGLNVNSILTLSNGYTVAGVMDSSKRRIGDCYEVRVPGVSYTDPQAFGNHLKFESYALISGFEDRRLYNYKIHIGDKNTFIYCDANKDRWLVTIDPTPAGTKTDFLMNVTLKKFGEFFGTPQTYSYQLSVGDPAITTAMNGYKYEVVNFNKDGSLAIIGLCLENNTTESQSTCPFDRAYGYPLAFLKLQITNKTTLSASVYRSKTYCERTIYIPNNSVEPHLFYTYTSKRIEKVKNPTTNAVIRTTVTYGEYKDFMLRNFNTNKFVKSTLSTLPQNTTSPELDVTWSWDAVPGSGTSSFSYYVGNLPYFPSWTKTEKFRVIHVFIKDDNTLQDVECAYIDDSTKWSLAFTSDENECMSLGGLYGIMSRILNGITDDRVIISGDITSATGSCTINLAPYTYTKSGSSLIYALYIGGSEVSSVSFNSRTSTIAPSYYVSTPASGSKTVNVPDATNGNPDNSYTGPSSGTITSVPTTSYKNYKGWISKGTYTIDGNKYVTPFIQLYTNNLVGMVEGNANTSNPDNAHWDTGSGGTMVAMPIFNKNGSIVNPQEDISALTRYCSWHPVNNTFSGLYSVPVCYV